MLSLFLSLGLLLNPPLPAHALGVAAAPQAQAANAPVPFYSQFRDIASAKWQKVGCGITSLAMIIDYYKPAVPVNTLLAESLALGAYSDAGWTYAGLIATSKKYGLQGAAYDLGTLDMTTAYGRLAAALAGGPVIASVHYRFDPKSTIPHLVVLDSVKDGVIYYNDPAEKVGEKTISIADFEKGWKKRYIVIRPQPSLSKVAYAN